MLQWIRNFINNNKLYAWMLVFVILIQAYSLFVSRIDLSLREDPKLAREEFRIEVEQRQEAMKEVLLNDVRLAQNLGIIMLLGFSVFIAGIVFLIGYVNKKNSGIEQLPKTLNPPTPLWGVDDVLKVIILFLFSHDIVAIFALTIQHFFSMPALDRRSGIVFSTAFMDILVLLFMLKVVIDRYHQHIDSLGVSLREFRRNIQAALYAYAAFLPILALILIGVMSIARLLNYTPAPEPIYELIFKEQRPILLFIIPLLISLVGPVIEEIFFRGFLYGALRKTIGISWAIFLSAFLFSFLHTNLLGFLPILSLGLFLAYLREKTGSLIPSITVHIVHNTALASMMFFVRYLTARVT